MSTGIVDQSSVPVHMDQTSQQPIESSVLRVANLSSHLLLFGHRSPMETARR